MTGKELHAVAAKPDVLMRELRAAAFAAAERLDKVDKPPVRFVVAWPHIVAAALLGAACVLVLHFTLLAPTYVCHGYGHDNYTCAHR